MLESEKYRIDEHKPSQYTEYEDSISGGRLINIQNQAGIECLQTKLKGSNPIEIKGNEVAKKNFFQEIDSQICKK